MTEIMNSFPEQRFFGSPHQSPFYQPPVTSPMGYFGQTTAPQPFHPTNYSPWQQSNFVSPPTQFGSVPSEEVVEDDQPKLHFKRKQVDHNFDLQTQEMLAGLQIDPSAPRVKRLHLKKNRQVKQTQASKESQDNLQPTPNNQLVLYRGPRPDQLGTDTEESNGSNGILSYLASVSLGLKATANKNQKPLLLTYGVDSPSATKEEEEDEDDDDNAPRIAEVTDEEAAEIERMNENYMATVPNVVIEEPDELMEMD